MIRICGNSQVAALRNAIPHVSGATEGVQAFVLGSAIYELEPFSAIAGDAVELLEANYRSNAIHYTGAPLLTKKSLWGLCMATHAARLYRDPFWKNAVPIERISPGKRLASETLIEALLFEDQRNCFALFEQMRTAGVPFFVVDCPPVRADHGALVAGTPPEIVQYVDKRARQRVYDWAAAHGVQVVRFPPEVASPDGFLRKEFAEVPPDPHHANSLYGALMIAKVLREVSVL